MSEEKELFDVLKNASEKEREKITRRLASLMVDVVTANAYAKAEGLMRRIYQISNLEEGDTLTVTYDISVSGNVLRAILAGTGEKNEENDHHMALHPAIG